MEDKIETVPTEVSDRAREVVDLMRRANDPDDPYDGHHGDDRTAGE